jgi:membrane-bound lytic murein transglycosylase B
VRAKTRDQLRRALDEALRLWLAREAFPARGDAPAYARMLDHCVDHVEASQRVLLARQRERYEASGGRWGRPPAMSPAQVESARAMRAEGRSLRAVERALGVPRSTLARTLAREARS